MTRCHPDALQRRSVLAAAVGSAGWASFGCAGYRSGWQSLPYIGARPPQEAAQRNTLELPGLSLQVEINNRLRTGDVQVMLLVVPIGLDGSQDMAAQANPGLTRVLLRVVPKVSGLVLRAESARFRHGGKEHPVVAGYELARWDAQGRKQASGGWSYLRLSGPVPLDPDPERPGSGDMRWLRLDFGTPPPAPTLEDIELDLSAALTAPGMATLPVIKFMPVAWSEGYT